MNMIKMIIYIVLIITICSCTNSKDANKALSSLGFNDIQITGYKWFACSESDFYHTGFTAKNAQGLEVKGTVCSGILFKNSTVRF